MAKSKEVKFQLGDCSDVFVKKVRGGYEVRVCGDYEGRGYEEIDSIFVDEDDVWNHSQWEEWEGYSYLEIAARLGFYQLEFTDDPLDC